MQKTTRFFLLTVCLSSSLNSFVSNPTHLQTVEDQSKKFSNYTFAASAGLMLASIAIVDIAFFKNETVYQ